MTVDFSEIGKMYFKGLVDFLPVVNSHDTLFLDRGGFLQNTRKKYII